MKRSRTVCGLALAAGLLVGRPGLAANPGAPPPGEFGEWLGWGIACGFVGSNEETVRKHLPVVLRDMLGISYEPKEFATLLSKMGNVIWQGRNSPHERDEYCGQMSGEAGALGNIGMAIANVAASGGKAPPPPQAAATAQARQPAPGSPPATRPAAAAGMLTSADILRLAFILSAATTAKDSLRLAYLWLGTAKARGEPEAARHRDAVAGRLDEAARRAADAQATGFPDNAALADGIRILAYDDLSHGKPADADALYQRYIAEVEFEAGKDSVPAADAMADYAEILRAGGRYAEARPFLHRVLIILETKLGPNDRRTATAVNNLAELERTQGRFDAAEQLYKRAIAALEKALGQNDPALAAPLGNFANLERMRGRFADAEKLLKRALAIREQSIGPQYPDVASTVNSLAVLAVARDRYDEAEPLYRRALSLLEAAYGDIHPNIGATLNNLATLYRLQGNIDQAEPLFARAVMIAETTRGAEHPETASALANLAQLYLDRGLPARAEPLFRRSLAALEKALGPDHPDVAAAYNNLAAFYRAAGRTADGTKALEQSIAILERSAGPDHLDTATALANLASFDLAAERYKLAADRMRRVHTIRQKLLGGDHPDVVGALYGLALAERGLGRPAQALADTRAAVDALDKRGSRLRDHKAKASTASAKDPLAQVVLLHLDLLAGNAAGKPDPAIVAESFKSGQGLRVARASSAVDRMAARFAAGTGALATTVRQRQDAIERWRIVDGLLVRELSKPHKARKSETTLRGELTRLSVEIDKLDREITTRFPEFAELSDPKPVGLADTQALLRPGEVILQYAIGDEKAFLWVVRANSATFVPLGASATEITKLVTSLRTAVDPNTIPDLGNPPPFPTAEALKLYRILIGPAELQLDGAKHVMIVLDGPLQSLPFALLVDGAASTERTEWLIRKYAFTTLPAISSLRALRRTASDSRAAQGFVGFGDPVLAPVGNAAVSRGAATLRTTPTSVFSQGVVADVNTLRKIPSLPETTLELRAMAKALNADEKTSLFLRQSATERQVRSMDLTKYRVVAFATHGLMSGEFPGVAEPALILTPPAIGSEQDDGLLTASEIAKLSMDADWTILSACNTAAADGTPGAEGLSGLARAFFYAGTRALLVSHWPVETVSAQQLTTGTIDALVRDPSIGRAEALRRSMLKQMDNKSKPHFAHPLYWAPFVVVGEGGAPK
ncbi:MAG: CHAT domain-containing protein [Rhodospirillales bacterium]